MSGNVKQFVDFTGNTNNDTGQNNSTSIQPIVDGEGVIGSVLSRPSESLRQRTEAIRNIMGDTLYLRDADRGWVITGPRPAITWPGSTTAAASGIPVISTSLWVLPLLTPGSAGNTPPVASAFGVLHLKRSSDSQNSISVTSRRRSYSAGDQINVTVASGASFSCVLDGENGLRRTIEIVATGTTTLGTVITALNGLTPPTPDNTQLVTAALENGALTSDFLLAPQAQQYVSGNFDGEAHEISPSVLAGFFTSNPSQALAEGDTLCVSYAMVSDTGSTGGRRQSILENSNTLLSSGQLFNSRSHPELLTNAIPICKVVNGDLVFPGGRTIRAGSTTVTLDGNDATGLRYGGGGTWADGTTNPATTVEDQLDKIITDLSAVTGTAKVGGNTIGSDLAAGPLANQVSNLATQWLKMSRDNTVTGAQTFTKNTTIGGNLTVGGLAFTFTAFTFTADNTTSRLTATGNPLQTGDGPIRPSNSGGALPTGLSAGTDYYWIAIDANIGQLALSRANALAGTPVVTFSTDGTGTQTMNPQGGTTRVTDTAITRNLTVDGNVTVTGTVFHATGYTYMAASGIEQVPDITKVARGPNGSLTFSASRSGSTGILYSLSLPVGLTVHKISFAYSRGGNQLAFSLSLNNLTTGLGGGFTTLINDTTSSGFQFVSSTDLAVDGNGAPTGGAGSFVVRADRTYFILAECVFTSGSAIVTGLTVN